MQFPDTLFSPLFGTRRHVLYNREIYLRENLKGDWMNAGFILYKQSRLVAFPVTF